MTKLKKILLILMCTLITAMGVNTEISHVKAASAKNFKGNLNATYKYSEQNAKITIKKINNTRVSVKIVLDHDWTQGTWNGKIISKDTIQFTLDGGEKIRLKWTDKTHFIAKRPKKGFSAVSVQLVKRLCYSLNNVKYTQVKKDNTVYYGASHIKGKDQLKLGAVSKITFKGNKVIIRGSLLKATSRNNLYRNKGSYLKKASRTFKLDKNFKFYSRGGTSPEHKITAKEGKILCKNANGLYLTFKVKNGKLVSLTFGS